MISSASSSLLQNYLASQSAGSSSSGAATTSGSTAAAKARMAATSQAALQAAGSTFKASTASQALDKRQAALATDLRAAMAKAGVKLSGPVEFSFSADGKVDLKGSDADQAATKAFLKADATRPSLATRIATQAQDALKLSTTIQQNAAISQAARFGTSAGGVMAL